LRCINWILICSSVTYMTLYKIVFQYKKKEKYQLTKLHDHVRDTKAVSKHAVLTTYIKPYCLQIRAWGVGWGKNLVVSYFTVSYIANCNLRNKLIYSYWSSYSVGYYLIMTRSVLANVLWICFYKLSTISTHFMSAVNDAV